jgi:hypothetical protein
LTDSLKELLRQYGMLAVSLSQLERERPGNPHASLQAYYDSLGTSAPGEPVLVVRISADGETRFRCPSQSDPEAAKYFAAGAKATVWELPEDEFHFFKAFQPALFDLEKCLPPFLLRMALVYGYTLFEDYLTRIIRCRLTECPAHLGAEKHVTYRQIFESGSKEELIETLVDREVDQLMHEPIRMILSKLRSQLGFRSLTKQYDEAVSRLSMIRNSLMHNAAKVSSQLAATDKTLVVGEELLIDSDIVSRAIGVFRKLAVAIDRELVAL